jgi:hypothetical protein
MTDFLRVFTLEVDGRPTLSFEASSVRLAMEIRNERWLRDDLTSLTSNGIPLCNTKSKISVRPANAEEASVFHQAAKEAQPSDDILLAYLVDLDGAGLAG